MNSQTAKKSAIDHYSDVSAPGLTEEELRMFNSILEGEGGKRTPRSPRKAKQAKPETQTSKKGDTSYRANKQAISIRLDADVLDWFRSQGDRYQSRMNAALREYMEAQDA